MIEIGFNWVLGIAIVFGINVSEFMLFLFKDYGFSVAIILEQSFQNQCCSLKNAYA
ncbi:hypothetical protein [Flavobacterium algoritolerans]|uniref:Uncharacterized protein n=1 Tax=Flavobacterium algoritolerans TaxID=3041254 RepID=A0ABT6V943_9FLAO|nr:hypothetical protein [Flavobacterium algoritolerans]MDI5894750.1 hypothetical protein [Flavobacterium algoritolerans]